MDPNFKVIIVGGSVSGLTLAHCLARAGINYVVLESHEEIAPLNTSGAGIIISPNASRVLDQLQLWQTIEDSTAAWERLIAITPAGKTVMKTDGPLLMGHRCV